MFYRFFFILFTLSICTIPIKATLFIDSTMKALKADGSHERCGTITIRDRGNNYATVSESEPIYIRARLNLGAKLAETLVDTIPNGGSAIYLPIRLSDPRPGVRVIAPVNTIQIVRWRKGEREIWFTLNHPSTHLIEVNGVPGPPTLKNQVEFSIGFGEETAHLYPGTAAVEAGEANLATPIRASDNQPVYTSIYADLREAIMSGIPSSNPIDDGLLFDYVAYNHETHGVETVESEAGIFIGPGTQLSFGGTQESTTIGTFGGYTAPRWITYMPDSSDRFKAGLIMENPTRVNRINHLTFFREDGSEIGVYDVAMPAFQLSKFSAKDLTNLFGERPSHIRVDGHRIMRVTAEYKGSRGGGTLAHVAASSETGTFFGVYPTTVHGFRGMIVVNTGTQGADVELSWLLADGTESERTPLIASSDLPSNGRISLDLMDFVPEEASGIRVFSDQPLSTVFLGGNNESVLRPDVLFQLKPITNLD